MPNPKDTRSVTEKEDWVEGFAERMRQLRSSRFGTQRGAKSQAAAAIDVTPSDWRGYENGVVPGADKICKICEALDCDANWLLGISSKPEQRLSSAQEKIVTALIDVQEALHAFDGMFTDCLVNLKDVLSEPEIAQAQCFKLYAIANRLAQLRREIHSD